MLRELNLQLNLGMEEPSGDSYMQAKGFKTQMSNYRACPPKNYVLLPQTMFSFQNKDLFMSLKNLLDAREVISSDPDPGGNDDIITKDGDDKNIITEVGDGIPKIISKEKKRQSQEIPAAELFQRSIYREMMFVTLKSFGQDNIDLTAFDREYRRAFDKLPAKYQSLLMPSDRPPNAVTVLCRKFFRELKIWSSKPSFHPKQKIK